MEEVPAVMRISQTEQNEVVTIPRRSVDDAPRLLGCYISMNGSWTAEYGRWRAEGARFAQKVKTARFKRIHGDKVYTTMWLSRLRYISPVVCFTEREAVKINNQVIFQCLPACGFNRHFPRAVVHGPARYGGMQWETCWSLQVSEKIKFFLSHIRKSDDVGKLLQILTESVQLQAGISEPVLETKFA